MIEFFKKEFIKASNDWSDIYQHMQVLYDYANKVDHITEFGVRTGVSTRAFLYSAVQRNITLKSYDLVLNDSVQLLFNLAQEFNKNIHYTRANTLDLIIDETDLLFIDTDHTYIQLSQELKLHGNKSRKYIILHDTETFPELNKAIDEFLSNNKHWNILVRYNNNNGLTILQRDQ